MKLDMCAWDHIYLYAKDGKVDYASMENCLTKVADAGIKTVYALPGELDAPETRRYFEICKDKGIAVHLWVIPFRSEQLERKLDKRLLELDKWPTCEERFYPCLNDVNVREASLPVTENAINNFGDLLAGIHLDYIRDDNAVASILSPCECAACRALRMKYFGKEVLTAEERKLPAAIYKEFAWKNANVTDLVRKYRALTNKYGIALSMAARANYAMQPDLPDSPVYGLGPAVLEGQDWAAWGEEGLLDTIASMNYHTVPETFKAVLEGHLRIAAGMKSDFYTGIGLRSSLGVNSPERVDEYIKQVIAGGQKGCVFFCLSGAQDGHFEVIKQYA